MQIEIVGTVETKTGNSKATGKPYSIRQQQAFAHVAGEKYPLKTMITPPDDVKDGYPIGKYEVDFDKSVRVDQYGLEFGFSMHLGKKVA